MVNFIAPVDYQYILIAWDRASFILRASTSPLLVTRSSVNRANRETCLILQKVLLFPWETAKMIILIIPCSVGVESLLTHVTRSIDLCHSLVTDSPKNNEPKNKQKPMGIVKLIDQLHRSHPSSLGDSYHDETQSRLSIIEQQRHWSSGRLMNHLSLDDGQPIRSSGPVKGVRWR